MPSQGCSYTDGPQYVGCQVAERGWPMPQGGGGKKSKNPAQVKKTNENAIVNFINRFIIRIENK